MSRPNPNPERFLHIEDDHLRDLMIDLDLYDTEFIRLATKFGVYRVPQKTDYCDVEWVGAIGTFRHPLPDPTLDHGRHGLVVDLIVPYNIRAADIYHFAKYYGRAFYLKDLECLTPAQNSSST